MESLLFSGLLLIGTALFFLGIKMFAVSDNWFYLVKSVLVTLVGLVLLGVSIGELI